MDSSPDPLQARSLEELRGWAWDRGRTDVVGRLDTRAATLAFVASPSVPALARLHDLLPVRPRAEWVESAVRDVLQGGGDPVALGALARNLAPWLALLSWQLVADLEEMAAGASGT